MTNSPSLRLIKYPHVAKDIIKAYEGGQPLPPALFDSPLYLQALYNYVSPRLENALHYYGLLGKKTKEPPQPKPSFVMHQEPSAPQPIQEFYHRLELMLEAPSQTIEFLITPEQLELLGPHFDQLINTTHRNLFLTGAPFIPGRFPHLDIFQWRNLYGVIKYVELDQTKPLKTNILIHFENRANRTLQECLEDYQRAEKKLIHTVLPQAIITTPHFMPQLTPKLQPYNINGRE